MKLTPGVIIPRAQGGRSARILRGEGLGTLGPARDPPGTRLGPAWAPKEAWRSLPAWMGHPQIPSWVMGLPDSGRLETNLEFDFGLEHMSWYLLDRPCRGVHGRVLQC